MAQSGLQRRECRWGRMRSNAEVNLDIRLREKIILQEAAIRSINEKGCLVRQNWAHAPERLSPNQNCCSIGFQNIYSWQNPLPVTT